MKTILSTAALAALMLSSPASADAGEFASASIRYADLNLSSASGAATMKGRIGWQADRICGGRMPMSLEMAASVKSCRDSFVRSANARLQTYVGAINGREFAAR